MPEHPDRFPEGVPCWADLMTTDVASARDFYAALLGWSYVEGTEESGFYTMAVVAGATVAGTGAKAPGDPTPPAWVLYLAVDSADDTIVRAERAGGSVLVPAMDVATPELQGRMAIVADPAGAAFGLWQPAAHTGFGVVDEHGTVAWSECMSRDVEASRRFLTEVFGYAFEQMGDGAEMDYTVGSIGGEGVIGVTTVGAELPAEVPSYWMPTFKVDDAAAAAEAVIQGGGVVQLGPLSSPYGEFVVAADPQGAAFAVMVPAPMP